MKLNFKEAHVKWGVTVFIVLVAATLVFFAIYRFDTLAKQVEILTGILTPFIYGLVFAYLLCPIYNITVRRMYRLLNNRGRRVKKSLAISKGIASFVSLVAFFVVIIGVCWMIIPGLFNSVVHVIEILPTSTDHFVSWVDTKAANYPGLQETIANWVDNITTNVINYVQETIIPKYMDIASSISSGVFGVLNVLKNFFVGIIICVYFLNSKDLFAAQSKKLIIAVCKDKTAHEILNGAAFTNKTFGGFINGKLLDSLIIGILCFIVMSIFGWEYPLLISCIIGITNIIPFFGPFIGAVPSALLILMVDPMQCIYFLIFVLILQQLDGNVIGPKILGDSTGLSSFWVMFAILVGGGLFGFVGMIIGIPIFAVFYVYFCRCVNHRLNKRGYSVDIRDYTIDRYRINGKREEKNNEKRKLKK